MQPRFLVFSTGLFSSMPLFMYSELVGRLEARYDVVHLGFPASAGRLEALCERLNCTQVPLLIHSSFDRGLLRSPAVSRAVLVDPAVVPSRDGWPRELPPLTVIRTDGYDSFVPRPFRPQLGAEEARSAAGHADLLDAAYAEWGQRLGMYGGDETSRMQLRELIVSLLA